MTYLSRQILMDAANAVDLHACHFMCHGIEDAARRIGGRYHQELAREEFEDILYSRGIPTDGTAFNTPKNLSDCGCEFPVAAKLARVEFLRSLADELFPEDIIEDDYTWNNSLGHGE